MISSYISIIYIYISIIYIYYTHMVQCLVVLPEMVMVPLCIWIYTRLYKYVCIHMYIYDYMRVYIYTYILWVCIYVCSMCMCKYMQYVYVYANVSHVDAMGVCSHSLHGRTPRPRLAPGCWSQPGRQPGGATKHGDRM